MNLSTKCNCCIKSDVCANKAKYESAVKLILDCNIVSEYGAFLQLRDAKFIEHPSNARCFWDKAIQKSVFRNDHLLRLERTR